MQWLQTHQNLMMNLLVKCDGDALRLLWNREEVERKMNRDGIGGVFGDVFEGI